MIALLFLPLGLLALILVPLAWIQFGRFLIYGNSRSGRAARSLTNLAVVFPLYLLIADFGTPNDCCSDSAIFSPGHRLSIAVVAGLSVAALFYSSRRKRLAPPLLEVIVNCLLILGIILDVAGGIQLGSKDIQWIIWVLGILPIAFQFLFALADNHGLALESGLDEEAPGEHRGMTLCRKLLCSPSWTKFPLLLLLCLPLLTLLAAALLVFGQKPDSLVRAFTDTYYHGFSQLDYQCAGVVCGGHFLCTIAAKGSPRLVRPIRIGVRAGRLIQCNRQLLVSNAFEELLEQRLPWLHRPVRALYNKIGNGIHRYYGAFDKSWVSNGIYLLMKPLEWLFLLVLYLADRDPETRIAQQYLHRDHRRLILNQNRLIFRNS
jgi:hypothetical protein